MRLYGVSAVVGMETKPRTNVAYYYDVRSEVSNEFGGGVVGGNWAGNIR